MEMKKVKMGLIGVFVLCLIFGSKIDAAVADAFDCYDACTTACVQPNLRLQSRCEIKCGIKCDRGLTAEGSAAQGNTKS